MVLSSRGQPQTLAILSLHPGVTGMSYHITWLSCFYTGWPLPKEEVCLWDVNVGKGVLCSALRRLPILPIHVHSWPISSLPKPRSIRQMLALGEEAHVLGLLPLFEKVLSLRYWEALLPSQCPLEAFHLVSCMAFSTCY